MAAKKKEISEAEQKKRDAARREAFRKYAGIRVAKVLDALESLRKCSNRKTYEFSTDDVKTMKTAIAEAEKGCMAAYEAALAAPTIKGGKQKTVPFVFGKAA